MFDNPEPMGEAWYQVEEWLDRDGAWVPVPTRRHRAVLTTVLAGTGVRGDLVPGARNRRGPRPSTSPHRPGHHKPSRRLPSTDFYARTAVTG